MNKFSKKVSKYSSSKTKKNNTKKQNGAGLFSIKPKKYTNIKYGKSGNITPNLICLQCKNDLFRHHNALHNSRMRAIMINSNVLDKKYNIFICYKCGFMMNYSGDITYQGVEN